MSAGAAAAPTAATARMVIRGAALEGAKDITPMVLGVLPFAVAIGAVIGQSSVPALAAWVGGLFIFGGGAQLTVVEMLDADAAPVVIVASALALNGRLLMYGASIAPWFRTASLRQRLVLAAPLIDPLYITSVARFDRCDLDAAQRRAYYLGAAAFLGGSWMAVQGLAILAGGALPSGIGLHLGAPLAFAGLLAKMTVTKPAVVAAMVAEGRRMVAT